jgi:xanthine dehydrogenase YagS FAD-binding subunit
MEGFAYSQPGTLREAFSLLTNKKGKLVAGATDLLGEMQDGIIAPSLLVSLERIQGLKTMREEKNVLRIGSLVTLAEMESDKIVAEHYPLLAAAAGEVATPQLRAQATIGGNLCQRPRCWYYRGDFNCLKKGGAVCYAEDGENQYHAILGGGPCHIVHPSDMAVALLAMGASVRIAGPKGEKTVPLEKFFVLPQVDVKRETILGPGEILAEIRVPKPLPEARWVFRKLRERGAWDFALASVAAYAVTKDKVIQEARIVLGGVAPIPWRAVRAEQALKGKTLTGPVMRLAAEAAVTDARPLSQNEYKIRLTRNLVRQALATLA